VKGLEQGVQEFVVFGQTVVFCHAEISALEVRIDVDRPIPGLKSFCVEGSSLRLTHLQDGFDLLDTVSQLSIPGYLPSHHLYNTADRTESGKD
jgi:hypothetical protein